MFSLELLHQKNPIFFIEIRYCIKTSSFKIKENWPEYFEAKIMSTKV